jgi:hypothetical protein
MLRTEATDSTLTLGTGATCERGTAPPPAQEVARFYLATPLGSYDDV